ncbi:MAG: TolC family protein, partial [Terriglobales bacterium]
MAVVAVGASAQTPSPTLDLTQVVQEAWKNYPVLLAAQQAAQAATAQTALAQTALLPSAGLTGQWDRATDNATLGLNFASPLPGISGTVPVTDYSQRSVWTSA